MDLQVVINILLGVLVMLLGFIGVRLHNRQDEHDRQLQAKLDRQEFDRVLERFETRVEKSIDRAVETITKAFQNAHD